MDKTGMSAAQMLRELNTASGLLGVSGRTADMAELLSLEAQGDTGAGLAIELFCRRARQYLGGYVSELGGVDVIAFGGGIGEHSPELRARILRGLEWAGIALDPGANRARDAGSIAAPGSRTLIEVIRLDEASILAAEAAALLGQEPESGTVA
jgi:acetate kinase